MLALFFLEAPHFLPTEPMREARDDLPALGGVTGGGSGSNGTDEGVVGSGRRRGRSGVAERGTLAGMICSSS